MIHSPHSVFHRPAGLKSAYRRMVLVSHADHVAGLAPESETLVVASDWLAWRLALDKGLDALHAEHALEVWPAERGDPTRVHLRAGGWIALDGRDATLFQGVSLGRLFVREVTLFANAWERLWHGLDRLAAEFRPAEIVLVDLRGDFDVIPAEIRRNLATAIAVRHGATLIERPHGAPLDPAGFPEGRLGVVEADPPLRRLAKRLLTVGLEAASRLRRLGDRRPPILFIHNWATLRSLLATHGSEPVVPAFFAGHMPKTVALLGNCLRRGFVLAGEPRAELSGTDHRELAAIAARFERAWAEHPAEAGEQAMRDFIRAEVFGSPRLIERAGLIKGIRRLFDRHRFVRVVVGDVTNYLCRAVAGVARQKGVPVDELFNGVGGTAMHMDARCGDVLAGPDIDRLLTWGEMPERWFRLTGAVAPMVRTGYPAMDGIRHPSRPLPKRIERILVLPNSIDSEDPVAPLADIFAWLTETVLAVGRLPGAAIRVKLHPGYPSLPYFARVVHRVAPEVEVVKDTRLAEHVGWADLVVGPVHSGGMLETLALGKPYYPVRPSPSMLHDALMPPAGVIGDVERLAAMLAEGKSFDGPATLDAWCSIAAYPSAGRRVWQVLGAS